jgi:hypothetical protein
MTHSGPVALRGRSGITWALFLKQGIKATPGVHDYPVKNWPTSNVWPSHNCQNTCRGAHDPLIPNALSGRAPQKPLIYMG